MKKTKQLKILLIAALVAVSSGAFAQVKIGDNPTTINLGSVLEVESTNKGLLMPRVSLNNTTTWGLLGTPAAGMHVFNTNMGITSTNASYPTLVAKVGEYYWDGTGWVALAPSAKNTTINSFVQSAPGVNIEFRPGWSCDRPVSGASVPACATDLSRNGTFTVSNPSNDVTIDLTGYYSIANNNSQVQFYLIVAIDKTTPGVFEVADAHFISHIGTICSAQTINFKTALKDLPARAYSVKIYFSRWYFNDSPVTNFAYLGFGAKSRQSPVCGEDNFASQKLIISVSQ